MKTKLYLILFLLFNISFLQSQEKLFEEKEISISKWIDGTLLTPINYKTSDLAIIIAGSGPTDRNGNQNFLKNNSLKKLAEGLTGNGIATFRYDKRVVKQIKLGNVDKNILFDDFISDAVDVINYFKAEIEFTNLYVIGHSQGSLIGMIASKNNVDGFISLAGAGKNIGDVIVDQVNKTAPMLKEDTEKTVQLLKNGETTDVYPAALASMFNKEIQPFMINWMSYNPSELVKELDIPILILNGTKDLQVSEEEAKLLKESREDAELVLINNMNHVLFEIEGDDLENSKSYNESFRPISRKLIYSIVNFIKS